jgi:hypothetical protein
MLAKAEQISRTGRNPDSVSETEQWMGVSIHPQNHARLVPP